MCNISIRFSQTSKNTITSNNNEGPVTNPILFIELRSLDEPSPLNIPSTQAFPNSKRRLNETAFTIDHTQLAN
jgi:hypothetical protein